MSSTQLALPPCAVLAEIGDDLAALKRVLDDLKGRKVVDVVCVGNASARCTSLLRAFSPTAVILRGCDDEDATLPLTHWRGPDLFVHATPEDPLQGVLRLRKGDRALDPIFAGIERFMFCAHHDSMDAGSGRSSVPALLIAELDASLPSFDVNVIDYGLEGLDRYGGWYPQGLNRQFAARGRKAIVNVGAARDGSYVLLHDDVVTWSPRS